MSDIIKDNLTSPEISNSLTLANKCRSLLLKNADFTTITDEVSFCGLRIGEYPNSYRSIPFAYSLGEKTYYDQVQESGTPPFLDKKFSFIIMQRRDGSLTHPELDSLPELKIILPIDSRCHYGYGRVEYYTDTNGRWRTVKYDKRPAQEKVKKVKNVSSNMEQVLEIAQGYLDAEDNANLEIEMGVDREATAEEIQALLTTLRNTAILNESAQSRFKGIFSILESLKTQEIFKIEKNSSNT